MRAVAQLTGVPGRRLRAWRERGVVVPTLRTDGGFHRYSPEDVRRVRYLVLLCQSGIRRRDAERALGSLCRAIEAELRQARAQGAADALHSFLGPTGPGDRNRL